MGFPSRIGLPQLGGEALCFRRLNTGFNNGEWILVFWPRIILIDGQRLTDLMIEHNVGVRTARTVEYKRIDEDFFSEDE